MVDYGRIVRYNRDRGFGFVDRSMDPSAGEEVFFHISVVRRKFPEMAERLDSGEYRTFSFWYAFRQTDRGDTVAEVWMHPGDIPEQERGSLLQSIERLRLEDRPPDWLMRAIADLYGDEAAQRFRRSPGPVERAAQRQVPPSPDNASRSRPLGDVLRGSQPFEANEGAAHSPLSEDRESVYSHSVRTKASSPLFRGQRSCADHADGSILICGQPHMYGTPSTTGERAVADGLRALLDSDSHLWFSISYLPGVRDIDLLLYHREHGVFAIELKCVPIEMVVSFNYRTCQINGRPNGESPQLQAHRAMESLRHYLYPLGSPPFIVPTVCWPKIRRKQWQSRWDNDVIAKDLAEKMIFYDDMVSRETLHSRLDHIWGNPPIRQGSKRRFQDEKGLYLSLLQTHLDPQTKPLRTESDMNRLRALERSAAGDAARHAPPNASSRVLYEGYPGTGKTFRLLQVGVAHAKYGKTVLFVCFNKTLAADLRRLASAGEVFPEAPGRLPDMEGGQLEIIDIFAFASPLASANSLQIGDETTHDQWGEAIVERLLAEPGVPGVYDTVLIDEAQDFKDWMFELTELYTKPDATICVAYGKGQDLYSSNVSWLQSFGRNGATRQTLRRNFRNTRPMFLTAQGFYSHYPNVEKAVSDMRRHMRSGAGAEGEIDFDRPEGSTARILLAPGEAMDQEQQSAAMVDWYADIVRHELDGLGTEGKPLDILVLVPSSAALEYGWMRDALDKANQPYIDYVREESRRDIAQPHMVRLCTYHSARGIEGTRVIILGFEKLDRFAESLTPPCSLRNLAYIVLSRSLFDTTVMCRRLGVTTQFLTRLSDATASPVPGSGIV